MVFKTSTALGTHFSLPILSTDEREKFKEILQSAKDLRDKDTEGFLQDLLTRIDATEATIRNLYKTLTVYRNRIPKLIRATMNKKKEV